MIDKQRVEMVKKDLRANAIRFNIHTWGESVDRMTFDSLPEDVQENMPPCRTFDCVAGETLLTAGLATIRKTKNASGLTSGGLIWTKEAGEELAGLAIHLHGDPQSVAAKWLGMTYPQSDKVFIYSNWPVEYRIKYSNAETQADRVEVALSLWDAVIAEEDRGSLPDSEEEDEESDEDVN